MLVSQSMEVNLDRQWAPHQFSADYGAVQDAGVNSYISDLGNRMAMLTHRPNMPYSFRAVNTVDVNGYTFPAGSVALGRGLLVEMNDESELAAVLGHELGHVSARHAGSRMSSAIVAEIAVAGLAAYVEHEHQEYADIAAGLGGIGAALLLARYSRSDERQADALGMEYCERASINPKGMAGVMKKFMELHDSKPSAVEVLFATHPMSEERYKTALAKLESDYAHAAEYPVNRDRYMDAMGPLLKDKESIRLIQKGQEAMMAKKLNEAEGHLKSALAKTPDDYAGLLVMAKCLIAQNRNQEARQYVDRAKQVYPTEPQAEHLLGMAQLKMGKFYDALGHFQAYERELPGNPNTIYFRGHCYDKMGRKEEAAAEYRRYQAAAPQGEFAGVIGKRLAALGGGA